MCASNSTGRRISHGRSGLANGSNGHKTGSGKVRVAIVGVGNCASSLVQGVQYYRNAKRRTTSSRAHARRPGRLPHLATSSSSAAFDIDANKVGKDLSRGDLHAAKQHRQVLRRARPGRPGAARHDPRRPRQVPVRDHREGARARPPTSSASSRRPRPTWSSTTCRWAAKRPPSGTSSRCCRPGCAFVNCIPVFIAREPYWQQRFEQSGLPIIGDDIKSQVGATIVHRVLTRLFARARRARSSARTSSTSAATPTS